MSKTEGNVRVRKRTVFTLLPALLAMGSASIYAGGNVWTGHGPEGGFVSSPLIDPQNPSTLYVSGASLLFKTTDAAAHWSALIPARLLAVDPQNSSTLYGMSFNGAFIKSTDGGASWNPASSGLNGSFVSSLAIDPAHSSTLYVATRSGPFKSTDGAASWSAAVSGLPDQLPDGRPFFGNYQDALHTLVIDTQGTLYLSARPTFGYGGLFKSTDGAASWSAVGAGLPDHRPDGTPFYGIGPLVIDPHEPSTMYVISNLTFGYGGGLFKSTDGAVTWSDANSGLTGTVFLHSLTIDPANSNILYLTAHRSDPGYRGYSPIGGTAPTLFKSTDAGSNWTVVNTGFAAEGLAIDPQDSGTLYAPTETGRPGDRGISKSKDGGATWSAVFSGPLFVAWVLVAPREQTGTLGSPLPGSTPAPVYAGLSGFGIFKSTDGGTTWATANSGLTATNITAVAVNPRNPSTLYTGVYGAGIFKSADSAATWSWDGLYDNYVASLTIPSQDPSTLYAVTYDANPFKSTDEGRNWVTLDVQRLLAVDPRDPNTIYGLKFGLGNLKSIDGGVSWVKWGLPQPAPITALAFDPQNPGTLYAGTVQDTTLRVFKSFDGGVSWTSVSLGSAGLFYMDKLVVDPRSPDTVYAFTECDAYYCDTPPNYKSTDGGATWAKWELPEFSTYLTIDPQGTIYAAAGSRLFQSVDSGTNWSAVTNSGLIAGISSLAVDPRNPNHLFAGTGAGVFEITLVPEEK